jgi:hypothetical protein
MCAATCRSKSRSVERAEPGVERVDRHRGRGADRRVAHAHAQRLGLEPRAAARGALLRGLVLPEEDADVLLVALLLLAAQERERAHEAAPAAVQHLLLLRARQLAHGRSVGIPSRRANSTTLRRSAS